MISLSNSISQVAVVSSCQIMPIALRALFSNGTISLAWHSGGNEATTLQQQAEHPVDLLILTMHVYQDDLLHFIRLIEILLCSYPTLRLIVVLDVNIPYLVSQLQDVGVENIISQKLSLTDWRKTLLDACNSELSTFIRLSRQKPLALKKARVSFLELHVMRYLVQGFTVREIAVLMKRSVKTITNQKNRALKKMGIGHYAHFIAVQTVFMASQHD